MPSLNTLAIGFLVIAVILVTTLVLGEMMCGSTPEMCR